MRTRIWPWVGVSFGALLLLVPLFAWIVSREAAQLDLRSRDTHRLYQQADSAVTEIRTGIYQAALVMRGVPRGQDKRPAERRIAALRLASEHSFDTFSSLLDATQHTPLVALRKGLNEYWTSLSDSREEDRGPEEALGLAAQIDALNEANLSLEEAQIQTQQRTLRRFAAGTASLLLALGCAIAAVSTAYLARLERVSENEKTRAEKAEYELRRLSNQLVRAQEDERRTISRELHDEVGQILTGLRMELGSLPHGEAGDGFRQRLDSVKRLAEDALRSVRNIALLLRPSMLDDLGLEPALRWQAKEFSRRSGIAVSVEIQGKIETLPEAVRICMYRVVQEALTNCAKHAQASRVTVAVKQEEDLVTASIRDNGQGFDAHDLPTQGLGLVGMEERVRALHGRFTVSSHPREGTTVGLALPLTAERPAAPGTSVSYSS